MIRNIYNNLRSFSAELRHNNLSSYAASVAFFVFLSFIPILLLLFSTIRYLPITEETLNHALFLLLPSQLRQIVTPYLEETSSHSIGLISMASILALWSAGKGVFGLVYGLNAIHKFQEDRNWLLLRLRACLYTLAFIAVILFSLIILVYGNILNDLLTRLIPGLSILVRVLLHFRFLFVWAFFTLFFQILYTFLPSKRRNFQEQFAGALFSSIGWSVFSWVYSLYLEHFDAFSIYGSLATIIVSMIWLYTCMYILLLGAQINRWLHPVCAVLRTRKRKMKNHT